MNKKEMPSVISQKQEKVEFPPCLLNEEAARAEINRIKKPYEGRVLFSSWEKDIGETLHLSGIEKWGKKERDACLRGLGRFGAGLYIRALTDVFKQQVFSECKMLAQNLDEHRDCGVKALMRLAAIYIAKNKDTNTTGDEGEDYQKRVVEAIKKYKKDGIENADEILLNPFDLKKGIEIFYYDKKANKIASKKIDEVIINPDEGLVTFDDEDYSIEDFNYKLAAGELMMEDGGNFFGGAEQLEKKVWPLYDLCKGDLLTIDATMPFEKQERLVKIKFLGSNIKDIESKCGKAFLPFIGNFPKGNPLLTIDAELEGNVKKGVDFRFFRILSVEKI